MSTYASEGGNFGFFTSNEWLKRLNAKIFAKLKGWVSNGIRRGNAAIMWRIVNQYMIPGTVRRFPGSAGFHLLPEPGSKMPVN